MTYWTYLVKYLIIIGVGIICISVSASCLLWRVNFFEELNLFMFYLERQKGLNYFMLFMLLVGLVFFCYDMEVKIPNLIMKCVGIICISVSASCLLWRVNFFEELNLFMSYVELGPGGVDWLMGMTLVLGCGLLGAGSEMWITLSRKKIDYEFKRTRMKDK